MGSKRNMSARYLGVRNREKYLHARASMQTRTDGACDRLRI